MGHGHLGDRGHCHLSNLTCDMGTTREGPPCSPTLLQLCSNDIHPQSVVKIFVCVVLVGIVLHVVVVFLLTFE